MGTGMFLFRSK